MLIRRIKPQFMIKLKRFFSHTFFNLGGAMIKSRITQIIYLSVACTVGAIGVLASVGLFEAKFRWDFYVYFTNISNYFCIAVLVAELVQTVKRGGDDFITALPTLKFTGVLAILLTALVYNVMLAPTNTASVNLSIRSLSLHAIIPLLYIADWFLFYERGKLSWKHPLYALSLPVGYVAFVFLHAAILGFDAEILNCTNGSLIYPYFFLNVDVLGFTGVLTWMGILVAGLLAFGFALFGLDRLKRSTP